jgi:DNA-binding PadR family transcriptional regulator
LRSAKGRSSNARRVYRATAAGRAALRAAKEKVQELFRELFEDVMVAAQAVSPKRRAG